MTKIKERGVNLEPNQVFMCKCCLVKVTCILFARGEVTYSDHPLSPQDPDTADSDLSPAMLELAAMPDLEPGHPTAKVRLG